MSPKGEGEAGPALQGASGCSHLLPQPEAAERACPPHPHPVTTPALSASGFFLTSPTPDSTQAGATSPSLLMLVQGFQSPLGMGSGVKARGHLLGNGRAGVCADPPGGGRGWAGTELSNCTNLVLCKHSRPSPHMLLQISRAGGPALLAPWPPGAPPGLPALVGFSAPSVWEALGGQAQERVDRGADSSALGAGLRGQVGTWVWGPLCIPGGEINPFRFWKGWAWGVLEEGVSVGGNPGRLPKGGSQKGGGTANRHSQVMVNGMGLGTTEKPKEENQLCWHQTQASPRVHTRRRAGRRAELLLSC